MHLLSASCKKFCLSVSFWVQILDCIVLYCAPHNSFCMGLGEQAICSADRKKTKCVLLAVLLMVYWNCIYRLSRISWALAQISCLAAPLLNLYRTWSKQKQKSNAQVNWKLMISTIFPEIKTFHGWKDFFWSWLDSEVFIKTFYDQRWYLAFSEMNSQTRPTKIACRIITELVLINILSRP